jgi:hypothetical protein
VTSEPAPKPPSPPGLAEFYSSQARLLLAQYQNIEQLLGRPTTDWTAPGTHCEVLLREFIRSGMPTGISVDKGFILGRRIARGEDVHSPEIDILIHDTLKYRPVFRLDDFVIVQWEAVLGVIQVKRALPTDDFRDGIANVMEAMEHIIEIRRLQDVQRGNILANDAPSPIKDVGRYMPVRKVYSAVVGFAEVPATARTLVDRMTEAYSAFSGRNPDYEEALLHWCLPDFIGSLSSVFAYKTAFEGSTVYEMYQSEHGATNIALQSLLAFLSNIVWYYAETHLRGAGFPPFDLPEAYPTEVLTMMHRPWIGPPYFFAPPFVPL